MRLEPWILLVACGLFTTPLQVKALTRNNLLEAFLNYTYDYEYYEQQYANASLTYSVESFSDLLQDLQHANNRDSETITLLSALAIDAAVYLNAATVNDLTYPGADDFNQYIGNITGSLCKPLNCSEVENADIFRTLNGTCNSFRKPNLGRAFSHQERLIRPRFFEERYRLGTWERTSKRDFELTEVDYEFSLCGIGARNRLNDGPVIIKAQGNTPLNIGVINKKNNKRVTDRNLNCASGDDPCFVRVPGAIEAVTGTGNDCTRNDDLLWAPDSNTVLKNSTSCIQRNINVRYFPYAARVVLQPQSSTSVSSISVNSVEVASSSNNKFAANEYTSYWLFFDEGTNELKISAGSEFSQAKVYMTADLSNIVDDVDDLILTVGRGGSSSDSLTIEFVDVETVEYCLDPNIEAVPGYGIYESIDHIPWTYEYYSFRFGVRQPNNNNRRGKVFVTLADDSGNEVLVTLDLSDAASSSITYENAAGTGTSNAPIYDFDAADRIDFKTVYGENFNNYDAFWIAWYDTFVYAGVGNQIAKGLITTNALEITNGLDSLAVSNIYIYAEEPSDFVIDITQPNTPAMNSVTTGDPLPTPLEVALAVHTNQGQTKNSTRVTKWVMQWGQFADHEFIATSTYSVDGHAPVCCDNGFLQPPDAYSEAFCLPISITSGRLNATELLPFNASEECQNFVRSAFALNCEADPEEEGYRQRQHINIITPWMDGSAIYGSSIEEVERLREANSARMHVEYNEFNNQTMLPEATTAGEACAVHENVTFTSQEGVTKTVEVACSEAGDFRAVEQCSLAGIHLLFVREHNRIVGELLNQGYTQDNEAEQELLFQTVRAIIAAIQQSIHYNQFLPSFVSNQTIHQFNLFKNGCPYRRNRDVSPAILELFGLIYRLGHTWIDNIIAVELQNNFFNHTIQQTEGPNVCLEGLTAPCADTDRLLEETVSTQLFNNLEESIPLSLPSLNINRGRDHGTPTGEGLRPLLDLPVYNNFDELLAAGVIDTDTYDALTKVYDSYLDVDTFTAAVIELPDANDPTTSIGPISNTVLGHQFDLLKRADRFWYECQFRDEAIAEIEKWTLGSLLCDNVDGFGTVQRDVFLLPSNGNQLISCSSRPTINYSVFSRANNGGRRNGFGNNVSSRDLDTVEELLEALNNIIAG